MFGRFTSQERTNVHRTAFFLHTPDFSWSKVTALKVVWGKDTSRRSKEPGSDLLLVFLGVGAILQMWVTSSYIQIWLWPGLFEMLENRFIIAAISCNKDVLGSLRVCVLLFE